MRQRLLVACIHYALARPMARDLSIQSTPDGRGWRFISLGGG